MAAKVKVGVLGASGYTGSECVRLLLRHPQVEIALLTAERSAGKRMRDVFPQFAPFDLPTLVALDGLDWVSAGLDVAFCALPHGTTQTVIKALLAAAPSTKVIDLSADFRLADPAAYAKWYGHAHEAPELQKEAVYGLTEVHRREMTIRASRNATDTDFRHVMESMRRGLVPTEALATHVVPELAWRSLDPDAITLRDIDTPADLP